MLVHNIILAMQTMISALRESHEGPAMALRQ
jgi:hypothetical protein